MSLPTTLHTHTPLLPVLQLLPEAWPTRCLLQVHYIVASAQVWMITRYDLYHTFRPAVLLLMFLSVYKAFVME